MTLRLGNSGFKGQEARTMTTLILGISRLEWRRNLPNLILSRRFTRLHDLLDFHGKLINVIWVQRKT